MQMRLDENCKTICKLDSLSGKQAQEFQERIDDEYRITLCAQPNICFSHPSLFVAARKCLPLLTCALNLGCVLITVSWTTFRLRWYACVRRMG